VAVAASAAWIDARVASPPELSPTTAEPALECPECGAIQPSMPMTCRCGASPVVAALPAHLGGFLAVRRRLGSGGMGIVYLGRDLRLDRDVALKTLPAIGPHAVARLRREARAMASLNHDALATIYGLELWRDVPVLVCEYFPNGTLADRLMRTGPLSPVEAVRLGARLARGLEYMHAGGVLHGDIKPANIGFTARNDATLLDFGLTRLAAASLADGMHHSAVGGTLAYLSPEALRGEPSSPSLDLWALAIVLIEGLLGHNPVARGHAVLTRAAIAAADPVSLTAPIRAFDPPLAEILTRALGPVGARFASAGAFADALERGGGFSER
jgi:serine/threonine protein kinase